MEYIHPNLLSVAPMMDRTDLHFRNLIRLISIHNLQGTLHQRFNCSSNVRPSIPIT